MFSIGGLFKKDKGKSSSHVEGTKTQDLTQTATQNQTTTGTQQQLASSTQQQSSQSTATSVNQSEQQQTAQQSQQQQQLTQALPQEAQELVMQLLQTAGAGQGGMTAGAGDFVSALMNRAGGADADNAAAIEQIIGAARQTGQQAITQQATQTAAGAGSKFNTFVQGVEGRATGEMETQLAGMEGQLALQARQQSTQELSAAMEAIAAMPGIQNQELGAVTQLIEALKGGTVQTTGTATAQSSQQATGKETQTVQSQTEQLIQQQSEQLTMTEEKVNTMSQQITKLIETLDQMTKGRTSSQSMQLDAKGTFGG